MKCICALSGGMDSATVLGEALHQGRECQAVGFNYNSKHNRWENAAAKKIAEYYEVPFRLIDLSQVMKGFKSALTSPNIAVPEGHYEEENMRMTVVPNRNMIFLSILTGLAVSEGCEEIWLGIHAGDRACYPDCRPSFITAMQLAVWSSTKWEEKDLSINLVSPFLYLTKKDILRKGYSYTLPVPYHLTRTCYTDNEISCGRCGACSERRESFQLLGIKDPIPYSYTGPLPEKK